ncbi:MAG: 4Fe-4S dicluster domain-containing protein [Myxococcales bacterium]|nr:4Fe-4S dicluster domain-containing protein [Myxococcales bacterium]
MNNEKLTDMDQSEEKLYFRSLEDLSRGGVGDEALKDEWSTGELNLSSDQGIDRRKFLGLMGASMAFAGLGVSGCIRKPVEYIMPYTRRPEDLIPGSPLYYATGAYVGGKVVGLLVESQEGRPTKIEGNPKHPMSNPDGLRSGASDAWSQAEVMHLYDPNRSKKPKRAGKPIGWKTLWKELGAHFKKLRESGSGLALVVDSTPSPTLIDLLKFFTTKFRGAKLFRHDPFDRENERAGLALVGAGTFAPLYHLDRARVTVAIDSDLLATEGDTLRNARLFAKTRKPGERTSATMSRLYAIEPRYSNTGLTADNRLRLPASHCGGFLKALFAAVKGNGNSVETWANAASKSSGHDAKQLTFWVHEVAGDLKSHRGSSVVTVGERQPAWVHALALRLNDHLGNVGDDKPLQLVERLNEPELGTLDQLVLDLQGKKFGTVVILSGNPVYASPADTNLGALLKGVKTLHLSSFFDETSSVATWHVPKSHFLEGWGDLRATDGTVTIQQPLIAPLYGTVNELELLSRLAELPETASHKIVESTWKKLAPGADFEKRWQTWLHDGLVTLPRPTSRPTLSYDKLDGQLAQLKSPSGNGLELNFIIDPTLGDGRYANIAWLQELPDPITKLTWDNALLLSPKTAKAKSIKSGDIVALGFGGRTMKLAAWLVPGIADNTLVLPLGYGRTKGSRLFHKKYGGGFNAYALQTTKMRYFGWGAQLSRADGHYDLASTQEHGTLVEPLTHRFRPLVRDFEIKDYKAESFKKRWGNFDMLPGRAHKSLWKEPNKRGGLQWAMTIDLNACIGCNACTIACQAENNVSVVGKKEVMNGREMHWIRIDRYFTAPTFQNNRPTYDKQRLENEPQIVIQPLPCQHCENAPCENVCPVGATLHSPEGLNDIAYNRCIGTRYCKNNCPYKVRRFNFYNFSSRNDADTPLLRLQRNPDVTVRFRGVVEKCSYCVQRIQEAKINAKVDPRRNGNVREGDVISACAQACPSNAIAFGNKNDPTSLVAKNRLSERHFSLLADLNVQPRTTYLAKLRNPNPKLV